MFLSGKDAPDKTSVRFGKCIWEALTDQSETFLTCSVSQINLTVTKLSYLSWEEEHEEVCLEETQGARRSNLGVLKV